jgi:hypothetical protein
MYNSSIKCQNKRQSQNKKYIRKNVGKTKNSNNVKMDPEHVSGSNIYIYIPGNPAHYISAYVGYSATQSYFVCLRLLFVKTII